VADYSAEVAVYDILNCGPRNRFVANGLIVHNCQYRISAAKLLQTANVDYDMGLSMQDAEHIHNTYYATYPGVKQYWHRQILQCRRKGYAETIAGRRVQLKGSWTARSTKWKQESTAVNFPIQGIGADQKYLAMRVVKNYLTKFAGRFYFELHDGLYALLPEANALQQAQEIQQALNNLPYKKAWGFTPPIPLPWDLKMGKTWGSMKEIK
jgi:DNA polymerase-1